MKHAVFVAPFGELADPRVVAELAAEAEGAGWDGFFVWDHIRYAAPVRALADAWITLAELAAEVRAVRGDAPFDFAVDVPPGTDPAPWAAAGATWMMNGFGRQPTYAEVRRVIKAAP